MDTYSEATKARRAQHDPECLALVDQPVVVVHEAPGSSEGYLFTMLHEPSGMTARWLQATPMISLPGVEYLAVITSQNNQPEHERWLGLGIGPRLYLDGLAHAMSLPEYAGRDVRVVTSTPKGFTGKLRAPLHARDPYVWHAPSCAWCAQHLPAEYRDKGWSAVPRQAFEGHPDTPTPERDPKGRT